MARLLDKFRSEIAKTARELREERRWSQAQLGKKIGISQSRLSEIEGGAGSFTAEQLLALAQLFNVPPTRFAGAGSRPSVAADVQNALARLGATHVVEADAALPSERLESVHEATREALTLGEPRLLTALAPVVIEHVNDVSLFRLDQELGRAGLVRRLPWFAANVVAALDGIDLRATPVRRRNKYRRAATVLEHYLAGRPLPQDGPEDLLDATVRSQRTIDELRAEASPISRRWGVVTALQPADFTAAIESARAGDR
jgi:HTH-type transcriptional regulator / antitoxin HipB